MKIPTQSQNRTRMFSRVLGPFFAVASTVVAVQAARMPALLSQFTANQVWPWVDGAFTLMGGIAIVAFHQYWRSAAAVIISVLGWLLVARGFLLLAFPDTFASVGRQVIGAVALWRPVYAVFALMGVYLTYVGWAPQQQRPRQETTSRTAPDVPRAA